MSELPEKKAFKMKKEKVRQRPMCYHQLNLQKALLSVESSKEIPYRNSKQYCHEFTTGVTLFS